MTITTTEDRPPMDPKEVARKAAVEQRKRRPFYNSLHNAKKRAAKAHVPFDLTEEYLESIFTGTCPVFNTRLRLPNSEGGLKAPNTVRPSLDRIRPDMGYVPGNVIWISLRANQIKNDADPDQIQAVADWLRETMKEIHKHEAR